MTRPRDARGRFVKRTLGEESSPKPSPFQRAATRAPIRAIHRSDLRARGRKATLWQRVTMRIASWFDVGNVRGRPSLEYLRSLDGSA